MTIRLPMTIALLLAVPAIALAQTAPPQTPLQTPPPVQTPPTPPPQQGRTPANPDYAAMQRADVFRIQAARRAAMRDPERVALAERLATLINAGDCAQALTIVEAARDADMAGNVEDACKIDPTARGG